MAIQNDFLSNAYEDTGLYKDFGLGPNQGATTAVQAAPTGIAASPASSPVNKAPVAQGIAALPTAAAPAAPTNFLGGLRDTGWTLDTDFEPGISNYETMEQKVNYAAPIKVATEYERRGSGDMLEDVPIKSELDPRYGIKDATGLVHGIKYEKTGGATSQFFDPATGKPVGKSIYSPPQDDGAFGKLMSLAPLALNALVPGLGTMMGTVIGGGQAAGKLLSGEKLSLGDIAAIASMAGNIPGLQAIKPVADVARTASQAQNLAKAVESGDILKAATLGAGLAGKAGVELPSEITDALKVANQAAAVKAAASGDINALLNLATTGYKTATKSKFGDTDEAEIIPDFFEKGGEGYMESELDPYGAESGWGKDVLSAMGLQEDALPVSGNLEQDFVVGQDGIIRDTAGNEGYFDPITGNWVVENLDWTGTTAAPSKDGQTVEVTGDKTPSNLLQDKFLFDDELITEFPQQVEVVGKKAPVDLVGTDPLDFLPPEVIPAVPPAPPPQTTAPAPKTAAPSLAPAPATKPPQKTDTAAKSGFDPGLLALLSALSTQRGREAAIPEYKGYVTRTASSPFGTVFDDPVAAYEQLYG